MGELAAEQSDKERSPEDDTYTTMKSLNVNSPTKNVNVDKDIDDVYVKMRPFKDVKQADRFSAFGEKLKEFDC